MTASELKKSILQMAVEGKLTEQNKNDEPAEKLLKRIKEEKEKLIKEGKIKKEKTVSEIYKKDGSYYERVSEGKNILKDVCLDEELPFDIPDSWVWVRLGNISNFGECINAEPSSIPNDAWVLELEDIEKDSGKILVKKKKYSIKCNSTKHVFNPNQILYSKLRPYLNKVVISDEAGFCTSEILPILFYNGINIYYSQIYFMSPFFVSYAVACSYGVKMPRLSTNDGKLSFYPLPPIEEQRRIAEKINLLMPLINEYDELEKSITKLNKEFPHNIKKSVLQYAIEGKLTEQNKNDEPAEKLLKRIKEEKEKLIKEGRIKKEKTTSEIYKKDGSYYERVLDGKNILKDVCIDDELPFDIPDSWVWCNVSDIANIYTGNSINENEKKTKYMGISSGYCYIATKDVGFDNIINYDNGVKIPNLDNKFRIAPKNSILLCIEGGSAGKKISVTDRDVCFGNKLCCFDTVSVNVFFMYYYLQSPLFNSIFKENINGIIGGVSINKLKQLKIPLPPIEEQNRIVRKIKKFNEIINTIK